MSESYKIAVKGEGTLHRVKSKLEFHVPVKMKPSSSREWVGKIKSIEVQDDLDYDVRITAAGRVKFTVEIENTRTKNVVFKKESFTNVKFPNAAIVHGVCKAQ